MTMTALSAFLAKTDDAFDVKVLDTFTEILTYNFYQNYLYQKLKFIPETKCCLKMKLLITFQEVVIVFSISDYENLLSHVFLYSRLHVFIQHKFVFLRCFRHCDCLWMEFNKPSRRSVTLI